jgi:hypothetical protein
MTWIYLAENRQNAVMILEVPLNAEMSLNI